MFILNRPFLSRDHFVSVLGTGSAFISLKIENPQSFADSKIMASKNPVQWGGEIRAGSALPHSPKHSGRLCAPVEMSFGNGLQLAEVRSLQQFTFLLPA